MSATWERCRRAFSWVERLPPGLVVNVATLGPVGRCGPAPGTLGSIAGLLLAAALRPVLDTVWMAPLAALGVYLGVAFCDRAAAVLGDPDPGKVILDEVLAVPLCFLGGVLPAAAARGWPWWATGLAAFALFRLFDILKPLGIARLQRLPGGLGIMIDDLAAALVSCAVLQAAVRLL